MDEIERLEKQLADAKAKKMAADRARLWKHVDGLREDDLKLLYAMIHVHLYGDGEDD